MDFLKYYLYENNSYFLMREKRNIFYSSIKIYFCGAIDSIANNLHPPLPSGV